MSATTLRALLRAADSGSCFGTDAELLAAFAVWAFTAPPAAAQDPAASFPDRPIRIIVPFPAGGPTDILSRVVGQRLSGPPLRRVVTQVEQGKLDPGLDRVYQFHEIIDAHRRLASGEQVGKLVVVT